LQDLSPELAQGLGLSVSRGALINRVENGTPAARAGLQIGDVISAMDGQPVETGHDLVRAITRHSSGERIAFTILRSGRTQTITATTAPRPSQENAPLAAPAARQPANQGPGWRLATLAPDLASRLGVPANAVAVAAVEPGGAADEAGLRRSDVILQADGRAVRSPNDLQSALSDGRATLLVRRGQSQVFIPMRLD